MGRQAQGGGGLYRAGRDPCRDLWRLHGVLTRTLCFSSRAMEKKGRGVSRGGTAGLATKEESTLQDPLSSLDLTPGDRRWCEGTVGFLGDRVDQRPEEAESTRKAQEEKPTPVRPD